MKAGFSVRGEKQGLLENPANPVTLLTTWCQIFLLTPMK